MLRIVFSFISIISAHNPASKLSISCRRNDIITNHLVQSRNVSGQQNFPAWPVSLSVAHTPSCSRQGLCVYINSSSSIISTHHVSLHPGMFFFALVERSVAVHLLIYLCHPDCRNSGSWNSKNNRKHNRCR